MQTTDNCANTSSRPVFRVLVQVDPTWTEAKTLKDQVQQFHAMQQWYIYIGRASRLNGRTGIHDLPDLQGQVAGGEAEPKMEGRAASSRALWNFRTKCTASPPSRALLDRDRSYQATRTSHTITTRRTGVLLLFIAFGARRSKYMFCHTAQQRRQITAKYRGLSSFGWLPNLPYSAAARRDARTDGDAQVI